MGRENISPQITVNLIVEDLVNVLAAHQVTYLGAMAVISELNAALEVMKNSNPIHKL